MAVWCGLHNTDEEEEAQAGWHRVTPTSGPQL
jgi:hypothetical protein